MDTLDLGVLSDVVKIWSYFSVYTVRTESLKEFSIFLCIKHMLYHSDSRWLLFFPAAE
jgi:hypothetical protein